MSEMDMEVGGAAEAIAAATQARDVHAQVAGLSALALRELGFTDRYITKQLDMTAREIANALRVLGRYALMPNFAGDQTTQTSAIAVWDANRRKGSPWLQTADLNESREVLARNGIEPSGCHYQRGSLDLDGAEFVNQVSAQKIIVYSLNRWCGDPCDDEHANRHTPGFTGRGTFIIEHVDPSTGKRWSASPEHVGITASDPDFKVTEAAGKTAPSAAAFARVVRGIRRKLGALPPYDAAPQLLDAYAAQR